MWSSIVIKKTLWHSLILFAASAGVIAIAALIVWLHHTSLAQCCNTIISLNREPATYFYDTWFFADWLSLAMLAFVHFILCFTVAWLWGWVKRRFTC